MSDVQLADSVVQSENKNQVHEIVVPVSVGGDNVVSIYVAIYQQLVNVLEQKKIELNAQTIVSVLFLIMQSAESYPQLSGKKQEAVLYVLNMYLDSLKKSGKLDDITYGQLKMMAQIYAPQIINLTVSIWNGTEKLIDEIEAKCCGCFKK